VNCDRCGERPGVVRYTEYSDGVAKQQSLCAECVKALGFGEVATTRDAPRAEAAEVSDDAPAAGFTIRPDRRCPVCGLSGADFANQALFGCAHCYEAFDDDLDPLLKRLHGAVTHRGRLPHRAERPPSDEPALRRELDDALARRDYALAARLRDRLRALERGSPPRAGGPDRGKS
jgi:protein arginine kinase activator